jgi:hypothetical protein
MRTLRLAAAVAALRTVMAGAEAWRLSRRTGVAVPKPAPQKDCPAAFGNSDIFGAAVSDPAP